MPSLKDTKRRIVSVKNTQKITRAMKLVSSAKFSRANREILNSRPYREAFTDIAGSLIRDETQVVSSLQLVREERKILLVILSTDRGLCGGLNAALFRDVSAFFRKKRGAGVEVDLMLWGRRACSFGSSFDGNVIEKLEKVLEKPNYSFAESHAGRFSQEFEAERYDRVFVAYSHFKNALSQKPEIYQLLPVVPSKIRQQQDQPKENNKKINFICEPEETRLLDQMLRQQISVDLYGILLNGVASEHAARMTAMDNATSNADEVIKNLTLLYNRARQAAITKELIEITSGADAL